MGIFPSSLLFYSPISSTVVLNTSTPPSNTYADLPTYGSLEVKRLAASTALSKLLHTAIVELVFYDKHYLLPPFNVLTTSTTNRNVEIKLKPIHIFGWSLMDFSTLANSNL